MPSALFGTQEGGKIADALDKSHDTLMPHVRETRELLGAVLAHVLIRDRDIRNLEVHDKVIELRYLLNRVDNTFGALVSAADNLRPSEPLPPVAQRCSCEWEDDGDAERGPHASLVQVNPECSIHGSQS